eukprot:1153133-Pelagomonas_calceolata.AAC.10
MLAPRKEQSSEGPKRLGKSWTQTGAGMVLNNNPACVHLGEFKIGEIAQIKGSCCHARSASVASYGYQEAQELRSPPAI